MSSRSRYQFKNLSYRSRSQLVAIIRQLDRQSEIHNWRKISRAETMIYRNRILITELFRMANNDPKMMLKLMRSCRNDIRQTLQQLQQMRQQNMDPTHPSVINNPNHRLNPANPNALQLLLQVNPSLNPLFIECVNTQAAVVEAENLEEVENKQHYDKMMEGILTTEVVANALKDGSNNNSNINPYKELGVRQGANQSEIQAASITALAENAPEQGEKPSHVFSMVATAVALIGTHARRKEHDKAHEHRLVKKLEEGVKHCLKPISPMGTGGG